MFVAYVWRLFKYICWLLPSTFGNKNHNNGNGLVQGGCYAFRRKFHHLIFNTYGTEYQTCKVYVFNILSKENGIEMHE